MKNFIASILVALALAGIITPPVAVAQAPFQPAVPGAVTNYVNSYFPAVVQSGTFALTSGTAYVSGTSVATGDVVIYTPVTSATTGCFTSALQSGTGFSVGSTATTGTYEYLVLLP
jgi:hypothetical protein